MVLSALRWEDLCSSLKSARRLRLNSIARFAVNRDGLPTICQYQLLRKPNYKGRLLRIPSIRGASGRVKVYIAVGHSILGQLLDRRICSLLFNPGSALWQGMADTHGLKRERSDREQKSAPRNR